MIRVSGLVKKYGDFTAVDNISFEINRGEIFGFLGPNGAGKTTTIKMLTGLLKPSGGSISIGGTDILESEENFRKVRGKMGYIPDTPHVYEKLSGWEYLRFVSNIFRQDWAKAEERARGYLKRFNILRNADALIETYSHGMRQKLVFTSALIHEPDFIIVDEPMVGLDPKNVRVVKEIFREISARGGTVFLSTHTLAVAEELCSRVAIIFHGRIVALDSVDSLKAGLEKKFEGSVTGKTLEEVFLKMTEEQDDPSGGNDGTAA